MNDNPDPKKAHDEQMMLYQHGAEEIRSIKRLQWAIPNYVLLLFAASLWYHDHVKAGIKIASGIVIIDLIIAILGIYYLHILKSDLKRFRARLTSISEKFDQDTGKIFKDTEQSKEEKERMPYSTGHSAA